MNISRPVIYLSILIAVFALLAACSGLFWPNGGGPFPFTTLRGETVQMYGRGLYRCDTLFIGAGFRGQDTVTLALGIPLLVIFTILYRRGSRRGGLLLTGILAYFLYVYASMSLGAGYNPLFLVYIALFSLSFFAFVLAFNAVTLADLPSSVFARLPRRGLAVFMFAGGLLTSVVWLSPLVSALLRGTAPDLLDSYTTIITDALDLAFITPATIITGVLVLRRDPLGVRLAFPLLGIIILLAPGIAMSTYNQLAAGIVFPPAAIIGPISGFTLLGLFAIWLIIATLRHIPGSAKTDEIVA